MLDNIRELRSWACGPPALYIDLEIRKRHHIPCGNLKECSITENSKITNILWTFKMILALCIWCHA
jgi:hypothetical protein